MGAESGLRQRIRHEVREYDPTILIVGQPANGMTGRGRPDFYLVVDGRFVGLEVKTRTGRATEIQLDRIRIIRRAGGYAWIVRSPLAALTAVEIARRGEFVAEDAAFDIDALLAGFRKDDPPEPPAQLPLEELPTFDDVDTSPAAEEVVAEAAYLNGSVGGDDQAAARPQGMEILAHAIDNLAHVIAQAVTEVRLMRTAQTPSEPSEEPTSEPSEQPDQPTSKSPRRRRS